MSRTLLALAAATTLLFCGASVASASLGAPPAPKVRTSDGVDYLTGGVGHWERDQLESIANGYPLKLVFAERANGAYLGDVSVQIEDASGKTLLRARSDGPWFFTKLPDGHYRVRVTDFGKTFARDVNVVAGRQTTAYFTWPERS